MNAEINMQETIEALGQQSRAKEEHNRNGNLGGDEAGAQPSPARIRGSATILRQPIAQIGKNRKQPDAVSTNPSITNCRKRRICEAPNASRTAISRLPFSARTSSRLETFANPIRQRSPAPLSSATSVGRMFPKIASISGTRVAERSRLNCGYS